MAASARAADRAPHPPAPHRPGRHGPHPRLAVVAAALDRRLHLRAGDRSLVVGARHRTDGGAEPGHRAARSGPGVRGRPRHGGRLGRLPRHHGRRDRGARCCPATGSRSSTTATSSTRRCSRRSPSAQASITIEAYIYWAGEIGLEFARALAERARAGVRGEDPARCRRVGAHRRRDPEDARRRRLPARLVQPDPVVHHRPVQQPHAPQVARSSTAASRSRAAPASPTTGAGTRRIRTTGATCRSGSRARRVVPLQTGFAQNWLQTTGELVSGPAFFHLPKPAGRGWPCRRS